MYYIYNTIYTDDGLSVNKALYNKLHQVDQYLYRFGCQGHILGNLIKHTDEYVKQLYDGELWLFISNYMKIVNKTGLSQKLRKDENINITSNHYTPSPNARTPAWYHVYDTLIWIEKRIPWIYRSLTNKDCSKWLNGFNTYNISRNQMTFRLDYCTHLYYPLVTSLKVLSR